ncbi:MAG: cytochrome c oxidase assembly protein, partial [Candidatus Rokubacteria bacterium]|nr:cytochrome c oxidase assembly protein [Candidatus Rokubacteria bacterium]
GAVRAGLPWAFEPVQPVVRAQPGETLQTAYRVRNLSNREVAAKARHILDPPEKTGYLQVVNCFCFIQQTLKPREARELPVVFRVNGNVPKSLRAITVHYEFYPIDRFPAGKGR